MNTMRDETTSPDHGVRAPWDTHDVGNREDALDYAKRMAEHARLSDEYKADRDKAIRRLREEDGMTYRAIALLLGMTERNVQFIISGKARADRA